VSNKHCVEKKGRPSKPRRLASKAGRQLEIRGDAAAVFPQSRKAGRGASGFADEHRSKAACRQQSISTSSPHSDRALRPVRAGSRTGPDCCPFAIFKGHSKLLDITFFNCISRAAVRFTAGRAGSRVLDTFGQFRESRRPSPTRGRSLRGLAADPGNGKPSSRRLWCGLGMRPSPGECGCECLTTGPGRAGPAPRFRNRAPELPCPGSPASPPSARQAAAVRKAAPMATARPAHWPA